MANKQYPVGKAQQEVLNALGITATDFNDASQKFDDLGIVVSSKRQGRASVPVVSVKESKWSRNAYGDYDGSDSSADEPTLKKLAQWMAK